MKRVGVAVGRAVGLQNVSPGGGMAEQHCWPGARRCNEAHSY